MRSRTLATGLFLLAPLLLSAQLKDATASLSRASAVMFENPDSAYYYASITKALAIKMDNDTLVARAEQILGVVEGMKGHYSTSLEYFLRSLKTFEKSNATRRQSSLLSNIARVILAQQRYREAIQYLHRALALDQQHKDSFGVVSDYMNLGIVYRHLGMTDSALYYYKHAEQNAITLDDQMSITTCAFFILQRGNMLMRETI